jgi:hypothetical protein
MKARKSWALVSRVLRAENALPKVCGVFYKAVVLAVLLFGSETWKLSPASFKSLEGFHIIATRCMAGMQPTWNPDASWKYPSSKDVLKGVGLKTVNHYIGVCRETFARFIIEQLLFTLCWEEERLYALHVLVGAALVRRRGATTPAGGRGGQRWRGSFIGGQSIWVNYCMVVL